MKLVGLQSLRKCKTFGLRRRWVDNIKTNLQEVGFGVMDWIDLALDRWWTLVYCNEYLGCVQCREFFDQLRTGQLLKDFAP